MCATLGGKVFGTGAPLLQWNELREDIRDLWEWKAHCEWLKAVSDIAIH
jgi:hypothetical protein